MRKRQPHIDVSLPLFLPSLPLSLKINKIFKKKEKIWKKNWGSKWCNKGFYFMWSKKSLMFNLDAGKEEVFQYLNVNTHWMLQCSKEFQVSLCFIGNNKAFHCSNHEKLWFLWMRWVCLSTWLSLCLTCTVDRKPLSGQNIERQWFSMGRGVR